MFKRKNKNKNNQLTYDIDKYNAAYNQWTKQQPKYKELNLPDCIASAVADDLMYLNWRTGDNSFYIHASSVKDDKEVEFKTHVNNSHISAMFYILEAFLINKNSRQPGIILEGHGFYTDDFVEKALKLEHVNDNVIFTWIDYKKKPIFSVSQIFNEENVGLLKNSIYLFIEENERWNTAMENWRKEMPQKWQYPPIMEEE